MCEPVLLYYRSDICVLYININKQTAAPCVLHTAQEGKLFSIIINQAGHSPPAMDTSGRKMTTFSRGDSKYKTAPMGPSGVVGCPQLISS